MRVAAGLSAPRDIACKTSLRNQLAKPASINQIAGDRRQREKEGETAFEKERGRKNRTIPDPKRLVGESMFASAAGSSHGKAMPALAELKAKS
jgi:hypothetical protein